MELITKLTQRQRVLVFVSFTVFLSIVFIAAYAGLIPTEIKMIPYYDSIGHFTLYGMFAYLAVIAYPRTVWAWFVSVPISIVVIASIAITEEFLQMTSAMRTFSYMDILWGLLGIATAWLFVRGTQKGK